MAHVSNEVKTRILTAYKALTSAYPNATTRPVKESFNDLMNALAS